MSTGKIRLGLPKYRKTWSSLAALGFGIFAISGYVGSSISRSLLPLGGLVLAAAMSVMVAGMVAERRDWEQQHQESGESHNHVA